MAQPLLACWHDHRHHCNVKLDSSTAAGSTHAEDVPELEDEPEPLLLEPEPELLDEGDACLSRAMAAANMPSRRQASQLLGLQSPADASPQLLLQSAKGGPIAWVFSNAGTARRQCMQHVPRSADEAQLPAEAFQSQSPHRSTAGSLSAHLRPAACGNELQQCPIYH